MDSGITVLIVEDEVHIANLLDTNLKLDGHNTVVCYDAETALDIVNSRHIDIILMDVMLPDSDGIDLCRKIKHSRSDIAIMMLSALGQSADRIKGLKAGADDYLPKPFDLEELRLRMDNLISRASNISVVPDQITLGAAQVDFKLHTLIRGNKSHKMTSKEVLLLKFMTENRGEILSRQQILDKVWGFEHFPNTRTIDNFIATFRKYIEENPGTPNVITSIRGIGYRLN